MASLFKDPFTEWLISQQIKPVLYAPAAFLGAAPVGWRLNVGRSSFVYRIPEETPHILIIVLFERKGSRSGLRSPFADIVRFLSLVKSSDVGVTTVQGHVEAVARRPMDSLENKKIAAFYKRHLHVGQIGVENGIEWVGGNLLTFVPPLATQRDELDTGGA